MRPLYLLSLIILTSLISCGKDDGGTTKGRLDPNAMISLRPAIGVKSEAVITNPDHLTAKEIVEQAHAMRFESNYGGLIRGFSEVMRDIPNTRLLMLGEDIISQNGEYVPNFIEGYDIVFIREISPNPNFLVDTIAYIPNVTLRAAETAIKAAFAKEDYAACYKLFDEAFTFIPITGEEWRALKAAGTN